ncbi:MAG: ribonuclease III [Burkholderiales bacterium]|jgi:ribonuclease-3
MKDLEHKLNYQFKNPDLLLEALTHRSYGATNNERLEYLGDAALNLIIANYLFRTFPDLVEGEMTRVRAVLVNQDGLSRVARNLDIGSHIKLGGGEVKTGGAERASILADALEAIVGALYIDSGFENAETVVLGMYSEILQGIDPQDVAKDSKTLLQEYLQAKKFKLPIYNVVEVSGEAHEQHFVVDCVLGELKVSAQGSGVSRKSAEQAAAREVLKLIETR